MTDHDLSRVESLEKCGLNFGPVYIGFISVSALLFLVLGVGPLILFAIVSGIPSTTSEFLNDPRWFVTTSVLLPICLVMFAGSVFELIAGLKRKASWDDQGIEVHWRFRRPNRYHWDEVVRFRGSVRFGYVMYFSDGQKFAVSSLMRGANSLLETLQCRASGRVD